MATIKICDRCGASATLQDKPLTIAVPAADPATNQTAIKDSTISVDVQTPDLDLCAVCLASALVEYTLTRLGKAALTPEVVGALSKRINAVLAMAAAG